MKKKVEFKGKYVTVLPGVQQISNRTYRARVQVNGVNITKTFTNKAVAAQWYRATKNTKLTSK